jgi:hypothetical protein
VYGSSLSTTRPTSKLLLKDLLTTAFRTTTCPTLCTQHYSHMCH